MTNSDNTQTEESYYEEFMESDEFQELEKDRAARDAAAASSSPIRQRNSMDLDSSFIAGGSLDDFIMIGSDEELVLSPNTVAAIGSRKL